MILGVDAQQIGEAKEKVNNCNKSIEILLWFLWQLLQDDTTQFDQIIDEANFKDYILKVRAKMDTYNVSCIL